MFVYVCEYLCVCVCVCVCVRFYVRLLVCGVCACVSSPPLSTWRSAKLIFTQVE